MGIFLVGSREKQMNGEVIAHCIKKRQYFNGDVRKGILYVYNIKYEIKL